MIHYVNGKEPVGITYCGGNIFTGEVPQRDRVTLKRGRVTCSACRLLLGEREGNAAESRP